MYIYISSIFKYKKNRWKQIYLQTLINILNKIIIKSRDNKPVINQIVL